MTFSSFPESPHKKRKERHETSLHLFFLESSLILTFEGMKQGVGVGS